MLNPATSNDSAYAESTPETRAGTMSVKLAMDDPDVSTLTTQATTGTVNYISKGFTVTTENVDGYNVYVQTAPGSTNKLKNGNIEIDFVKTDTPTSAFTDNTWGYAVDSTGQTAANLKYNPVPGSTATNLNPAYSSTSTGETKKFTLNFAAKFASDATPGHYGTDVLLSVAAGAEQVANLFGIEYDSNNTGAIVPSNQSIQTSDSSYQFTIPLDTIPIREGYSFRGWSTNASDTEGLASYDPGTTITLQNSNPTLKLYAIWKPVVNKLVNLYSLQSMTNTACEETTTPSKWDTVSGVPEAQLSDNRDQKSYWIAKLADGRCWMTQNLNFDPTNKELKSSSSDVSANVTLQKNSTWNIDNVVNWITNSEDNEHSSIGGYYSYAAAVANTVPSDNSAATSSICPKGWKLPESRDGYNKLLQSYNISSDEMGTEKLLKAPLFFVRGGYIHNYNGTLNNSKGKEGNYWSSSATGSNASSYALHFDYLGQYTVVGYSSNTGMNIRCVAR